ncbi:hypothetical protein BT96DRAFT_502040 [Gymnopus androsaceus JB14]|uniref:Uncharacterized protein n=1 Tax=Gymnopus androsaceus JB14 TaxID=1447944 RepID=A0A6A4GML3_9AGAR|nr:hypothetical protein BT96DRAFT_502040 [Gymnopus androsaceus JB14]
MTRIHQLPSPNFSPPIPISSSPAAFGPTSAVLLLCYHYFVFGVSSRSISQLDLFKLHTYQVKIV